MTYKSINTPMEPRRLEALSQFVRGINQTQAQDEVFLYLAKTLEILIEADSRQIAIGVPNKNRFELVYADAKRLDQSAKPVIKLHGRQTLIPLMAGDVLILNSAEHPEETSNFNFVLTAPIMVDGELFALIKLGRYGADNYTDNDIQLMNVVLSVVSACFSRLRHRIDQHTATHRAETHAARLQTLADISLKLCSVTGEEALFHTICDTITNLFEANRVSYVDVQSDGDNHQLRVKYTYEDGQFSAKLVIIEDNLSALHKVIESREVQYYSNVSEKEAANHRFTSSLGLMTTWSIPISYEGNVVGIFNAGSKVTPDYEDNLFGLLSMLGSVLTAALARIKTNSLLDKRAHYDALTEMPNRFSIHKKLENMFEFQAEKYFTLFAIDVDRFKDINDFYGHQIGDKVLIDLAQMLSVICGDKACAARFGGDEFLVIVSDETKARENYQALLHKLSHLDLVTAVAPHIIEYECSMGSSFYPENAKTKDELIKQAFLALYEAKSDAHNRIFAYSPALHEKYISKISRRQRIQKGLDENEFTVFYQPIVDLKTGRVRTLEALARWSHPEKGVLPPAHFTQAFHEPALCGDLGRMVVETVTQDMARWRAAKLPVNRISLNVESANLSDPFFPVFLLSKIESHNLRPRDFIVEITENSIVKSQSKEILRRLEALNTAGIPIALDDFGTGYSSLTHLKELPISILKMDRSYVQSITINKTDRQIVKSLIELARCLDISCVAEGIETVQERDAVLSLGCGLGQGYFFARPIPGREIPELIRTLNGTEITEAARYTKVYA